MKLVELDNYHLFKGEKYKEILSHAKHLNRQKKIEEGFDEEKLKKISRDVFNDL